MLYFYHGFFPHPLPSPSCPGFSPLSDVVADPKEEERIWGYIKKNTAKLMQGLLQRKELETREETGGESFFSYRTVGTWCVNVCFWPVPRNVSDRVAFFCPLSSFFFLTCVWKRRWKGKWEMVLLALFFC